MPFNERFENLIQFGTSTCQALFFGVMAITPLGEEPHGGAMININLAAMGVVMAGSIKAQLTGMRRSFIKMKKNVLFVVTQIQTCGEGKVPYPSMSLND